MTVSRSPSTIIAPPSSPPPAWRKWAVRAGAALLLLATGAWAAFYYFFYNPLEGAVEDLGRVVPASASFAFRGSAEELLAAPFVNRRILERPETRELFRAAGVEYLRTELRRAEEQIDAELPGFLKGFTILEDVLGRETVAFGRPALHALPELREEQARGLRTEEEVARAVIGQSAAALATRLTPRGRMVFSVLKHEWARRKLEAQSGVRITRYPTLYEFDGSALLADPADAVPGYGAMVRDVLVVGNDRKLVEEAVRLARTGGSGSLPDRPDVGSLFAAGGDAPLRVFLDAGEIGRDHRDAGEDAPGVLLRASGGLAGLAGYLLDPDALSTLQATVSFPGPERCEVEADGIRNAASLPLVPEALSSGAERPAAEALAEAALLAPAGSAALVARAEMPAGALLKLAFGRLPDDQRKLIEERMAESGTSVAQVAMDADDYFQTGVSMVLERLPESDDIDLDRYGADERGRFLLPVPGYLAVLRQREGMEPGSAERFLRRRLEEWKDDLRYREPLEGLPEGMTGLRFQPKFLEDKYDLVRPAVAFHGDMTFLASNEGTLRRALEARAGTRGAFRDMEGFAAGASMAGEGQLTAFVDFPAWLQVLRDQRREVATGRVEVDWAEVRMREHSKIVLALMEQKRESLSVGEIEELLDKRMDELAAEQKEVAFPREVKAYLESLRRLGEMRSASMALSWDSRGLRLRFVLRTAD